jgi:mannose-1-phosphate guanylyltransferase
MIVLPADHVIRDVKRFHAVLETAIETAQASNALVTIGIKPTHPETGYGYIQYEGTADPSDDTPRAFPVKTFAEKPDRSTAERFIDSGDFLWNSGMFIWRAETIMEQMEEHLPEAYEVFAPLREAIGSEDEEAAVTKAFQHSPSISIDYGVMERADEVFVVPSSFGWSDVGDWRAVYELSEQDDLGNAVKGDAILHNASRCYVQSDDRLIVLVGVHDTVVVETDDAVLVCNRESTQQVKNVVEYLHANQLDAYV